MAPKVRARRDPDKAWTIGAFASVAVDSVGTAAEFSQMRYLVMTEVSPEEVLDRAKRFFAEHASLAVREPDEDALTLQGESGSATIRVDRAHGHTNVRVETDRVAGLDITDLTKRFLYTLGHV